MSPPNSKGCDVLWAINYTLSPNPPTQKNKEGGKMNETKQFQWRNTVLIKVAPGVIKKDWRTELDNKPIH